MARMTRSIRPAVICLSYLLSCAVLGAQEAKPPSVEDKLEAGGSSAEPPARRLVKFNEYDGPGTAVAGDVSDAGSRAAISSAASAPTGRSATSA